MGRGPKILVVGAGHAGLAATHAVLSRLRDAQVTLFEPSDFHLLKPRLHEAITGDRPITMALAPLIRSPRITRVRARVTAVDAPAAALMVDGQRYSGDFLVIAAGARTRSPLQKKSRAKAVKKNAPALFRLDGLPDEGGEV